MERELRSNAAPFTVNTQPPQPYARGAILAGILQLLLWVVATCPSAQGGNPPSASSEKAESAPTAIRTVVLDAGHGGKDPGTMGKNSREKDVVLAVVLRLGQYIERAFPDVNVIYTRKTDEFIELNRRSEIANKAGADLFISVHCNSAPSPLAKGTETYVMGLDVSNASMAVAQRENAVISLEDDYTEKYEGYDPDSPESFIIFSLMQNIFLNQSLSLASIVQGEFTNRVQRADRGVKQERFLVLYKSGMPSILVELGFLTHPSEEQFLISSEGQDLMASALFRAFRAYKESVEQKITPSMIINPTPPLPPTVASAKEPTKEPNPRSENNTKDGSDKGGSGRGNNGAQATSEPSPDQYLIQVACVKHPIEAKHPLRRQFPKLIEEKSGSYYRYYALTAATQAEAAKALAKIKGQYPDAFIVRKGK